MSPEPDLTVDLDAAEEIVTGRAETCGPWREVNDSAPAGAVKEDGDHG